MLKRKFSKILCSALALGLIFNLGISSNAKANGVNPVIDLNALQEGAQISLNTLGGKSDLAIANEEKIIEMLKKEGKIEKNATPEEEQKAFNEYMKKVAANEEKLTSSDKLLRSRENKGNSGISTFSMDQNETEVNVLALMIDFNDYKHNQIKPDETDMYYDNYTKEHFQEMLFGENGYTGPNGENLVSMKQYYDEQSGGTFKVDGLVTDWYTAPKDAAYYGAEYLTANDIRPGQLVVDALKEVAKDKNVDLSQFDKRDRYDLDGDGDYNEPDGIIDHLIIIHAGVGQEAGGGSLGSDAIWSHRSSLGGLYPIPGSEYYAYDYTIEPEDGAGGVFAHEFGHDIGLPDEYDTIYSSTMGEPISSWSIMSSGSWAGKIPGTEPPAISPYGRQILQDLYGGRWQNKVEINYEDLTKKGSNFKLNEGVNGGDVIRINLPELVTEVTKPTSGKYAYYGGKGFDGTPILNSMKRKVDLSKTNNPVLKFNTQYDIEEGWDFASVQVKPVGSNEWTYLEGNITTTERDPNALVVIPYGITGISDGWVEGIFDLSKFKGEEVEIKIEYATDSYTFGQGIYIDDIKILDGNDIVLEDDVEKENVFTLEGFTRDTGVVYSKNYYLVEWRSHNGVDSGLKNIMTSGSLISYNPGMVVWYVNEFYSENWTGVHPGGGYLSVIDGDQKNIIWEKDWKKAGYATNKIQMADAAFNREGNDGFVIDRIAELGMFAADWYNSAKPKFTDMKDYTNKTLPEIGVILPKLGVNIQILDQKDNNTGATIKISKNS